MHKTKKKTKTVKLPKPIKVKKEKSDEDRLPHSMTHYIDDRLEMVKQIFGTLKPKTIINLAPDFLKIKEMEEIEEACLNELLCISTKRLKSIINATRCPTDTESSDNDSDVERHEEHVSLEEISSDSEIEGGTSKKGKKKKSAKTVEKPESTDKKDAPKSTEAGTGDGQISVLELLELQARARAIRSQLALEPVTKIEVDSDEEKRNKDTNEKRSTKGDRKRLSSERESRDSAKLSKPNGSSEKDAEKRATKKIKIKRTYRTTTDQEKEEVPKEKEVPKEDQARPKEKELSKENRKESTKNNRKEEKTKEKHRNKQESMALLREVKKEKTSRSPSPDVIPIVAEPETLLISDSSDEENKNDKKKEKEAANEIKEKAQEKSQEKLVDNAVEKEATKARQREQRVRRNREPEEDLRKTITSAREDKERPSSQKLATAEKQDEPSVKESSATEDDNTQDSQLPEGSNKNDAPSPENKQQTKKNENGDDDDKSKKANDESNSTHHSDDDHNDDVISLGGDLENEMNEQLENEVNAIKSPREDKIAEESSREANKSQDESQNDDVISLESSDEERHADNQSWHSRYMKSSKVSKVLATSRLGKRVRDKIKKSKRTKKETSHENSESEKDKSKSAFTSKHEDGSIEQYKELLEIRQRKSSSS